MTTLEKIEQLVTQIYGKGAEVSVDFAAIGPGFFVRVWNKSGKEVDITPKQLPRAKAIEAMHKRLKRASFLRLGGSDAGQGDGAMAGRF